MAVPTPTLSAPAVPALGLARKVGAEAVGTFALVFAGCAAVMVDTLSGGAITHPGRCGGEPGDARGCC